MGVPSSPCVLKCIRVCFEVHASSNLKLVKEGRCERDLIDCVDLFRYTRSTDRISIQENIMACFHLCPMYSLIENDEPK